ncbi:MAG: HIT family protein [Patescibacteria group bacterium]
MENCIFCKIVKGEIPSFKVYEDENSLAFLDIHPKNQGQTLVIPKEHTENIYGLTDETMARLSLVVKKIAVAVKNGLNSDGVNLLMNNEEAAGQIIFHTHIHVVPRFRNDNFDHGPHIEYKTDEAETVAKKIKNSL